MPGRHIGVPGARVHSPKDEVWQVGRFVELWRHHVLCKSWFYPFDGNGDLEVPKAVLQINYRCPIDNIDCCQAAKDLLRGLLVPASRRISALTVLMQNFFCGAEA